MISLMLTCCVIAIIALFDNPAGKTTAIIAVSITAFFVWRMLKLIRGPAVLPAGRLANVSQ